MPISKTSHQYMYIVLSNFVSEQNLFSKINCRLVNFLIIYTITHCSFHFQFHYEISSRCKVIKKHMTIFPQRLLWQSKREKLEATGNHNQQQGIKGPFCLALAIPNGHMDNDNSIYIYLFTRQLKAAAAGPGPHLFGIAISWRKIMILNDLYKLIGMIDRNTRAKSKLNNTCDDWPCRAWRWCNWTFA